MDVSLTTGPSTPSTHIWTEDPLNWSRTKYAFPGVIGAIAMGAPIDAIVPFTLLTSCAVEPRRTAA